VPRYQRGNSKSGSEAYCADFLAPAGYAVFYPYMVSDVERSVRYLRHNAKEWNADPDRIALVGGSAGGFLSNPRNGKLAHPPGRARLGTPDDRMAEYHPPP
jgi:alpha-L-fucosidase 2